MHHGVNSDFLYRTVGKLLFLPDTSGLELVQILHGQECAGLGGQDNNLMSYRFSVTVDMSTVVEYEGEGRIKKERSDSIMEAERCNLRQRLQG